MSVEGFLKQLANLARILTSITAYVAASFTCGAVLMGVALAWKKEGPQWWFLCGALIPPGPLYFIFTSDRVIGKRLQTLRDWKNDGRITDAEFKRSMARAMNWRNDRLYGPRQSGKPES